MSSKKRLNFIQVGANDGKYEDLLKKYTIEYPMRGVLIEPQPDIYKKLVLNYIGFEDRISFENIAISGNKKPISIFIPHNVKNTDDSYERSIASSDPKITARQLRVKKS